MSDSKNNIKLIKDKIGDILDFIATSNDTFMDEKLLDKIVVRCACDC